MEGIIFMCSTTTSSFPSSFVNRPSRCNEAFNARQRPHRNVMVAAKRDASSGRGSGRDIVGEDMIVLRKRIREMEIVEGATVGSTPPKNWMEWEKKYHEAYNSDVCEAVGLLQSFLMKSRPSVALGLVALMVLSVATSTIFLSSQLLALVWMVVSAILHYV